MLKYRDLAQDQLDAIEFINSGEDGLLCADVGTGKTVISLTAAQQAPEVSKWLVAAPLLVATDTWANECAEWEHLQDFPVAIACGTEAQRIKALESDAPVTVINYENLPWLMEYYPRQGKKDQLPFDGLICDEIDKLKSVSTGRFKNFRNRIKNFKKRVGLTGTLLPTRLEEVWAQAYIVDGGESFGRSFYEWRKQHFYSTDYNQHSWAPFADTRDYIIESMADMVYRLKAVGLPEPRVHEPHYTEMPSDMRAIYNKLARDYYIALAANREVTAVNAGVLTGKLQQICAGFSYVDEARKASAKRKAPEKWHSKEKFDWLQGHVINSDRQKLVFYQYTAELEELKRRYGGDFRWIGGGLSNKVSRDNIAAWNSGNLGMLALHPQSAGHGLNLQKSHAHDISFLTMPWSGGMWKQVIGRLARRGNQSKYIDVYTSIYRDTIDQQVFDIVTSRVNDMEDFLDALEAARTKY